MRIAFWLPGVGFHGGVERHSFDLAQSLRACGHELVLLHEGATLNAPEQFSTSFDAVRSVFEPRPARGVDVVYVQKSRIEEPWRKLAGVPVIFASHDHDLTCVRAHRYTPLGSTPCHRAPGIGCALRGCCVRRNRDPGLPVSLGSPWALTRRLDQMVSRGSIITCSNYIRSRIVDAGAPPSHVHVVHPIPPAGGARDMTPPPREHRLVVVGQLVRGKGVDLAIEALTHLPSEVTLEIVGDGNARSALEQLAHQRTPGRVRFVGYVAPEQVETHYERARVVLVPSRWPEPFGMVGIEAMRLGRPVVGAAHGGIPEWLRDGEGGRLFAPGDTRALARSIRDLLRDPDAGDKARAYVTRRFRHSDSVQAVEEILVARAQARAA